MTRTNPDHNPNPTDCLVKQNEVYHQFFLPVITYMTIPGVAHGIDGLGTCFGGGADFSFFLGGGSGFCTTTTC
jgi:hypothetical protein